MNEPTIEKVLGIPFFAGTVEQAVARHLRGSGYVVIPAAPSLIKLKYDQSYREAMVNADLALADSGLLVTLSRLALGRRLKRISGVAYFRTLLAEGALRGAQTTFWIFASERGRNRAVEWLGRNNIAADPTNSFVAVG